jgi:hypothetical protein
MYRVCTTAESTEWFQYKAHGGTPFCNCSAGPHLYVCTRSQHHHGLHLAHNSIVTLASWADEDIRNNRVAQPESPKDSVELDPKYIITPYKEDIS